MKRRDTFGLGTAALLAAQFGSASHWHLPVERVARSSSGPPAIRSASIRQSSPTVSRSGLPTRSLTR